MAPSLATITNIIIFHLLFIAEREGLKCCPVTLFFNMQTKNTLLVTLKNGSAIPISLTTRRCVTFSTIALALVGESWRPIYSLKTQVVTQYNQLYICRGQIEL